MRGTLSGSWGPSITLASCAGFGRQPLLLLGPVPGWLPVPQPPGSKCEEALGLQNKTFILSGCGTNVAPSMSDH